MQIVVPGETRTRKKRKPNFPISGTMKPFGLYPIHVHPVLPGETLNSWEMKWRVLSMPIKNPLFGCWLETWVVYVKLTDIDTQLANMFISNNMATTGFVAPAAQPRYFTKAGQVQYIKMATEKIWQEYFANEGETLVTVDGVPQVKRMDYNWAQNLMFKPAALDLLELPSNPEGQLTGLDIMTMAGMSELTYEKYLEQYGVTSAAAQTVSGRPEILRYIRSWTQPTNTIEPTTGAPSSCWAWSDTAKSDKPKRFNEPGFLIVLSAARPKMLSRSIDASFVGELWGFRDFFPAYNLDDPAAGVMGVQSNAAPFRTGFKTDPQVPLLYDHRDLLSHGETFINSADTEVPYPIPSVSASHNANGTDEALRGQYPSVAETDALFSQTGSTAADNARRRFYYEGIAEMDITGHVRDTTL